MRLGVSLGLIVVVSMWPVLLSAQRDVPTPPAHLLIESELLSKLQLLAAGLHTEVVLCLQGNSGADTTYATDFTMPPPRSSTSTGSSFLPCPANTVGIWHNHPLVVPEAYAGTAHVRKSRPEPPSRPVELCMLSEQDIRTGVRLGYPFVVVAVDGDTWCWWTLKQVNEFDRRRVARGRSLPGQGRWNTRQEQVARGSPR